MGTVGAFVLGAATMLIVVLVGYWLLNHSWLRPGDGVA